MKREATEAWSVADQWWCEGCGYRLDGLVGASACPECGRVTVLSDPARRVGSAWQRGASVGSWGATTAGVLRSPVGFWDVVRVEGRMSGWLAVCNACVAGALGVGIPAAATRDAGLFLVGWPFVALTVWALTVVERQGIRFWGRVHGARVTGEVARAVCGHASAGWVVGGALAGIGWVASGLGGGGPAVGAWGWRAAMVIAGEVWPMAAGAVVGLLVFESLTYAGVRRMRFANRAGSRGLPES